MKKIGTWVIWAYSVWIFIFLTPITGTLPSISPLKEK